jgi:hypothetical protein
LSPSSKETFKHQSNPSKFRPQQPLPLSQSLCSSTYHFIYNGFRTLFLRDHGRDRTHEEWAQVIVEFLIGFVGLGVVVDWEYAFPR